MFNFRSLLSKPHWSRVLETVLVGALLSGALQMQLHLAAYDSITSDEPVHLLSGYLANSQNDYTIDPEHPFLVKRLAALPLLFQDIHFQDELDELLTKSHNFFYDVRREGMGFADAWLYTPGNDPEQIIYSARTMMVGLYLLFAFSVYFVARRYFGRVAGLTALLFFIFEPNMAAHGHLVNTDMPIAFFIFLTTASWLRYLQKPGKLRLVITAFLFGLSLYAKFSAVALIPIMGAMAIAHWFIVDRISVQQLVPRLVSVILPGLFILVVTAVVIWVGYGAPLSVWHSVYDSANVGKPYWMNEGRYFQPFAIPAMFWKGYWLLTRDMFLKREAYLFGMFAKGGWWFYFPVAFLIKTPLPLIFALFAGLAAAVWKRVKLTAQMLAVLTPPAGFMAISMAGTMNIGLRHIFPVYPYVIIWAGYSVAMLRHWLKRRIQSPSALGSRALAGFGIVGALVLGVWYVGGTAAQYPRLISYFNETIEPKEGWKALNDSNLDWGQNAREFRDYLLSHGIEVPNCTYFWSHEQLRYYGIDCRFIASEQEFNELPAGSLYFIDAMDIKSPEWAWARSLPLVDMVGDTIFVLRKGV